MGGIAAAAGKGADATLAVAAAVGSCVVAAGNDLPLLMPRPPQARRRDREKRKIHQKGVDSLVTRCLALNPGKPFAAI